MDCTLVVYHPGRFVVLNNETKIVQRHIRQNIVQYSRPRCRQMHPHHIVLEVFLDLVHNLSYLYRFLYLTTNLVLLQYYCHLDILPPLDKYDKSLDFHQLKQRIDLPGFYQVICYHYIQYTF